MLALFIKFLRMLHDQRRERVIIDEMIRIFMEDDDFDIYMKKQIEKGKLKHQANNLD